MLVRFSVSNFLSIKEHMTLKMAAGKARAHPSHVATIGKSHKLLKGCFIFGANASGKSNFIKAMQFAKNTILAETTPGKCFKKYFRIDPAYEKKLGTFQFEIYVNDQLYSYGFSVSYATAAIEEEWLLELDDNGEVVKMLFERGRNDAGKMIVVSGMTFKGVEDRALFSALSEDIDSDVMRHKTFLLDMSQRRKDSKDYKIFRDVRNWFLRLIIIHTNSTFDSVNEWVRKTKSRSMLEQALKFFKTGIESIGMKDKPFDTVFRHLPHEVIATLREETISAIHKSVDATAKIDGYDVMLKDGELIASTPSFDHGNKLDPFEYVDESDGTQRLFHLIPIFWATRAGSVVVIDELDRSLHTKATHEFIRKFYENAEGANSQLIATTHDTNIFDLDLLRQDEIWLVEKTDAKASTLTPLSYYKPRHDKSHNAGRDYLIGRYGAVPLFDNLTLLDDEGAVSDE